MLALVALLLPNTLEPEELAAEEPLLTGTVQLPMTVLLTATSHPLPLTLQAMPG